MIIARIMGGLGNQLFIYAAARALALRAGTELLLDATTGYQDDGFGRSYQLDLFDLPVREATAEELAPFVDGGRWTKTRRSLNRYLPLRRRRWVQERTLFDAALLDYRPDRDVYLRGYWQREAFFREIADTLRRELTFRDPPSAESREWAARIEATPSVFVHARRGEYKYRLSVSYYRAALARVAEAVPGAVFCVFADEPGWLRENLDFPGEVHVVDHNGDPSRHHEDLWLLSRCRHGIVANSSFSWWGAWLNGAPERVVVAPASWGYRAEAAAGWERLDNELEVRN